MPKKATTKDDERKHKDEKRKKINAKDEKQKEER